MTTNWARYEEAKRLHDSGMTYVAAGKVMGVSGSRMAQMVQRLIRNQARLEYLKKNPRLPRWDDNLDTESKTLLSWMGIVTKEGCDVFAGADFRCHYERAFIPYPRGVHDITIKRLNIIRAWLGAPPFVKAQRAASAGELARAIRLLEKSGYTVTR